MRLVMITGTSSGLGKAFFDLLHPQSVKLVLITRRFLPYQEMLAEEKPERLQLIRADLNSLHSLPRVDVLTHMFRSSGCDEIVLIHNAGQVQPIGAIGSLDEEQMLTSINVNFVAPITFTNTFIEAINQTGLKAQIVYISSGAAQRAVGGWALYCAAKAGCEMFFQVLALQYEHDPRCHIHVVNPGVMDTAMQGVLRASGDVYFPDKEHYIRLQAEGKLPSPDEVAQKIYTEHLI